MKLSSSALLYVFAQSVHATPRTQCQGPIRDVSSIAPAYVGPGIGLLDYVFPCVPTSNELQISTTSLLSTNRKADDTATTATCTDVLAAAETMKKPGTVLVMRHATTVMAQATRESFSCKLGATEPDELPCIAAVNPRPSVTQDDWFVNPNPKNYDRASSTSKAFIGNERNPQRQIDIQGAIESEIIGKALYAAGVSIGEYVSSAYDRAVNTARILQWAAEPGNEEDNVKLYWNISAQFEKHAQVYNLSFSEADFAPYWADENKTTVRFPDSNFRRNIWLNYVYRNVITDLAWSGETNYMSIHGLFVLRALNIYNERSVVTVMSANTQEKAEPTYSSESTPDNDGNEFPFKLADTDNVRFEFQMAPSAFGALNSCTLLADEMSGSEIRGLFSLDADKNFEISAEEFNDGCMYGDPSVKSAVFAALDSEGARFDDDIAAMNNMEKLLDNYEVEQGMNYTDQLDAFREIAKTVRLPRSLEGDGKISLGVVQESRHFEPFMSWPYPDRILRRYTEDLPTSFDKFDALYGPEHVLIDEVCGSSTITDDVVTAFLDDSILPDVLAMSGLFSACSAAKTPGPATLTYLFETYSAENCPEDWQGQFISRTQTQLPQGLTYERDAGFRFPDLYTGKERTYGDDYKQNAEDIPPLPSGTYKSRKLRLGAALFCKNKLTIEELSMSMCNHDGVKLSSAIGIDESIPPACGKKYDGLRRN